MPTGASVSVLTPISVPAFLPSLGHYIYTLLYHFVQREHLHQPLPFTYYITTISYYIMPRNTKGLDYKNTCYKRRAKRKASAANIEPVASVSHVIPANEYVYKNPKLDALAVPTIFIEEPLKSSVVNPRRVHKVQGHDTKSVIDTPSFEHVSVKIEPDETSETELSNVNIDYIEIKSENLKEIENLDVDATCQEITSKGRFMGQCESINETLEYDMIFVKEEMSDFTNSDLTETIDVPSQYNTERKLLKIVKPGCVGYSEIENIRVPDFWEVSEMQREEESVLVFFPKNSLVKNTNLKISLLEKCVTLSRAGSMQYYVYGKVISSENAPDLTPVLVDIGLIALILGNFQNMTVCKGFQSENNIMLQNVNAFRCNDNSWHHVECTLLTKKSIFHLCEDFGKAVKQKQNLEVFKIETLKGV